MPGVFVYLQIVMSNDYTKYVRQVNDLIRLRNHKYALAVKQKKNFIIFKVLIGLFSFVLLTIYSMFVVLKFLSDEIHTLPDAGVMIVLFLPVLIIASVGLLIGASNLDLIKKNQTTNSVLDKSGIIDVEYEKQLKKQLETDYGFFDFIAHTFVIFHADEKNYYQEPVDLSNHQVNLAALVLKLCEVTKISFKEVEYYKEYSILNEIERSQVFDVMKQLNLISIYNESGEKYIVKTGFSKLIR